MGESFFRSVIGPHHVLRLKFGEAALHPFTAASPHLYITHPHLLFRQLPDVWSPSFRRFSRVRLGRIGWARTMYARGIQFHVDMEGAKVMLA